MSEERMDKLRNLFDLSHTIQAIIDSKTTSEPFSSEETFWKAGFVPAAFDLIHEDIFAVFRYKHPNFRGNNLFPAELQSEIQELFSVKHYPTGATEYDMREKAESFVTSANWCKWPAVRKAVLRRLFNRSFKMTPPKAENGIFATDPAPHPIWLES